MERLTIPDVRVDEHTTRRTMIDARAVKKSAMDFYWRLKAYEDTERTPEEIDMDHEAAEQLRRLCRDCDLDRLEELVKADKEGRVVVHGRWVFGGDCCVICSECNEEESNNNHRNYCPNCGAKMDGGDNTER